MFKQNQAEEKCKKKPVDTLLSEYETRMRDGTVYRSITVKLGRKLGWHVLYLEFGT